MKWLYRILRLFFCPHFWIKIDKESIKSNGEEYWVGDLYTLQCKYCGEIKFKKVNNHF